MAESDDPVKDLVERLLTTLIAEPDPTVRWKALETLRARSEWVRRVTVRQMLDGQRTGFDTPGRQLGITGVRVGQLIRAAPATTPAFALGRALAVAAQLAQLAERPGAAARLHAEQAELVRTAADQGGGAIPNVADTATRWAVAARRNRHAEAADNLLARVHDLLSDADDLTSEPDFETRADIALGYHQEHGKT